MTANVECESEENTGEARGKNGLANVNGMSKVGAALGGSIPCSNTEESGEVAVNTLDGELGYINKAEHQVGVLLNQLHRKAHPL